MKKLSAVMVIAVALAGASWVFAQEVQQPAQNPPTAAVASDDVAENEVVTDEGYGNEDAEYYGSEGDVINEQNADDASDEVVPDPADGSVTNEQM